MLRTLAFVSLFGAAPERQAPPGFIPPAQAAKLEAKFLRNPRQLTFDGKSGEGYFSPDGEKVIFQSIRGEHPFYKIYVKDLKTGDEEMVSTGSGRTTCSYFHPDGQSILFASSHLDPEHRQVAAAEVLRLEELRKNPPKRRSYSWSFDPHLDIFAADLDGSNLVRLTDAPGYDAEGAYSSDGKRIAFCSFRAGNGNIYVMDADGGNVRQLTNSPGYDGGPFFSPDGKRIIFRGEVRKRDYLQIFVIDADGSNERQLTDNEAVNWGPYWLPDSRHIIYATSLHGHYNYELYLMDIETGKQERVTYTFGADVLPVMSPDGKRLLWTSKRGKNRDGETISQLWMADWVFPTSPAGAVDPQPVPKEGVR